MTYSRPARPIAPRTFGRLLAVLAAVLIFTPPFTPQVQAQDYTPLEGSPQTGDQIYYFPHLAVGASWQTTITYINYSPEEVTCRTDFISDYGTPLMVSFAELGTVDSRTDVLPPGGSVHQETDVDLSAPLAPGWARATCSGPVKASLLYRLHNSEGAPTAEAGVNATAVPATRFVTFAEQGEGQFGTGVAYANPSATPAFVTFTVRDTAGEVLDSVDRTLLPGGHDAHGMAELFDLTSFTGSIEVTSTEPIVSLSINLEAAPVFSSLPPGELDAAAQGSTTYYFPHLAVGASWQTTITYINFSSQEVTCQTNFLSDHGSPLMVSFAELGTVDSRTDVLPPGGSVHQETDVDLSALLPPGWARATCSGPVKASLLYRLRDSEGAPVAEAGINAAAVPATRFVTFAEQGEGQFGTGVAYANPFFTSAHVTFTARDTAGEVLDSVDRTLLPGGHDAHGMAELFDLTSFTGSLEVTSTVPIVSLSINLEAAPVSSSLPPGDIPGEMLAPTDEAAFNDLFVGKRATTNYPTVYVDFVSPGRFRETEGWDIWTGSYTYRNTGPNTGTLTFNYDDGDRCTAHLTFVSTTAGTATYTCNDGSSGGYNWLLVAISATGAPDLVIQTPSVSDSSPNAGGSFTLSATVRNQGNGLSASTTLRYYRSPDATISTSDTAVGTDAVGGLAASGTSAESISLTAPSTAGTYYYGACVDPVSGESATGNNCSDSRVVTVRSGSNLQIYNDNVFVLPVSENLATLWTRSGNSPPLQDYAARFYEHFNDEFDFLIFFANVLRREIELEPGSHDGAFFNHVKNDVQGIGLDTFSNNSNWESAGKLQGVIFSSVYEPYHPIFGYSDFRQGQLLHELMHRWANFVVPTNFGSHWGPSSPGGVLGEDISNMIDHGDGKFSAINIRRVQFSPIELYLAGFIPPEEVPDFQIAEDVEWLPPEIVEDDKGPIVNFIFTASGIKTYTIEDIIAEHGPRVPGHLQAQKDFRAAVILLVSEDYPATREILESVSDDVLWFSHAGEVGLEKGHRPVPNFYEATGGRGTITMDGLSQFQSRAGAKRLAAPSSFGTPPPPIVDLRE